MTHLLDLGNDVLISVLIFVAQHNLHAFWILRYVSRRLKHLSVPLAESVPLSCAVVLRWDDQDWSIPVKNMTKLNMDFKAFSWLRGVYCNMHDKIHEFVTRFHELRNLALESNHSGSYFFSGMGFIAKFGMRHLGTPLMRTFLEITPQEEERISWKCLYNIAAGEQLAWKFGDEDLSAAICAEHPFKIPSPNYVDCTIRRYYTLVFNKKHDLRKYVAFMKAPIYNWDPVVIRYTSRKWPLSKRHFTPFAIWANYMEIAYGRRR